MMLSSARKSFWPCVLARENFLMATSTALPAPPGWCGRRPPRRVMFPEQDAIHRRPLLLARPGRLAGRRVVQGLEHRRVVVQRLLEPRREVGHVVAGVLLHHAHHLRRHRTRRGEEACQRGDDLHMFDETPMPMFEG